MRRRRSKTAFLASLERLERREVPATWGIPWADPQHLTASFVPDGTSVEGTPSTLYQKLDAQLGAGNWEKTILSAIQTWASNANVNIGLVGDNGAPMGVAGVAQGDPRFGDIRISAAPLSPDVLAITSPYDPSTGTNSGDMILNSNANFQPGTANSYDLYTVALHEAGHIFGFADNSTDPTNFMYNGYTGPVTGLKPAAITALQSAYGTPAAGPSEQATGTLNFGAATALNTSTKGVGRLSTSLGLASDTALFKYTTIAGTDYGPGIDFVVRTSGRSLLVPKLTVYSSTGAVLGTASASGPLDAGAAVHLGNIANVNTGATGTAYYLAVTGTGTQFGRGAFQISAAPTNAHITNQINPAAAVAMPEPASYNGAPPLAVGGAISAVSQADLYSFVAPTTASHAFTIRLATSGANLTRPSFQVYDASLKTITQANAANPTGEIDATLTGYTPGAKYFIQVVTGGTTLGSISGDYRLVVDFAGATSSASILNDPNIPYIVSGTNAASAAALTPITAESTTDYRNLSSLSNAGTQATFKLTTPSSLAAKTMYVSLMGLDNAAFTPQVTVTTANGGLVNSLILCNEGGMMVVQIAQASAGTTYVFNVTGGPPGATVTTGNFALDVAFSTAAASPTTLVSGGLSQASSASTTTLSLATDQVYRFMLAAGNGPVGSGLRLQVFDAKGNVVATLNTAVNQSSSLTIRLAAGTYSVKVVPTYGSIVGNIQFSLSGLYFTDPIKVYASSSATSSRPTM